MNKKLWISLLLAVAVIAFGLVLLQKRPMHEIVTKQAAQKDVYYCPMHPQQRSDKPGTCPICSMKLVRMEQKTGHEGHAHREMQPHPETAASIAPNTIFIAPERQQLIGIKTVLATRKPFGREIRTAGKVAIDETKVTHIHTKIAGFVEEVFADFVGKPVKRGEPLFTIYSPDLVATQEEYLLALKSQKTLKNSSLDWVSNGSANLLEAAKRRLRLWDVSEEEIRELETSDKAKRALTVYSPVDGIVTERAAYHHGRYVTPELDLYTITDLSTVWVLGEVYEYELDYLQADQPVRIETPSSTGKRVRNGRISFISPSVDPKTRTVAVRIVVPNPDLTLRPDAYVTFNARVSFGTHLTVPSDALLDTGTEQYAFVDRGQGYFEPRRVVIGPEADGDIAIESGLKVGDRVVTAANFILDSESRLKGVFANMGAPSPSQAPQIMTSRPSVQIEILEPKTGKVGSNHIRLLVNDANGNPIDGADIDVLLFMPQMGSMAPMRSSAKLKPIRNGEYAGEVDIPMAWTWETTVTVNKDGKPVGSVKTSITAR